VTGRPQDFAVSGDEAGKEVFVLSSGLPILHGRRMTSQSPRFARFNDPTIRRSVLGGESVSRIILFCDLLKNMTNALERSFYMQHLSQRRRNITDAGPLQVGSGLDAPPIEDERNVGVVILPSLAGGEDR
jgi:hypothetical protein